MECCKNNESWIERLKALFGKQKQKSHKSGIVTKKIALIGNPNVGKSVIFNSLTGAYVTVSNYPGTTVEISKGWYQAGAVRYEVLDTPGMYSMLPITDEERVTRKLLLDERPDLVVHVIDAKNIERMLPLTLQLIEADLQVILVLNIIDEADSVGVKINNTELESLLGIPVLSASAALNKGMDAVKRTIEEKVGNAA